MAGAPPAPASTPGAPAASGYPDYGRIPASQAGQPGAAAGAGAGAALDNAGAPDYSAYGKFHHMNIVKALVQRVVWCERPYT